MNMKIILSACMMCLLSSCGDTFLDVKPDKALLVPETLSDIQALLDNNDQVINISPALTEISADNFATTDAVYNGLRDLEKTTYTWSNQTVQVNTVSDWEIPFKQIFYANVALEALARISSNSAAGGKVDVLKGAALFIRSHALYNLSQEFAAPYDPKTASQLPGIPIRLTSDVNGRSGRGTIAETYLRMIDDLKEAVLLLPQVSSYKSRPITAAAYALLSRIYLQMDDYENAGSAANSALLLNSKLIDYNTLDAAAARPFPIVLPNGNDEVIYYTRISAFSILLSTASAIDASLYNSYNNNDLRKTVFFMSRPGGIFTFKGNYTGSADMFGGIATDELYLTRAECYARKGNVPDAMKDLNALLEKRWKKGTFLSLSAANSDDALKLILTERRKELLFRGIRWTDLRRLNKDPKSAVTLSRKVNGEIFTLAPNERRYVLLIPQNEIAGSGIEQNPR